MVPWVQDVVGSCTCCYRTDKSLGRERQLPSQQSPKSNWFIRLLQVLSQYPSPSQSGGQFTAKVEGRLTVARNSRVAVNRLAMTGGILRVRLSAVSTVNL